MVFELTHVTSASKRFSLGTCQCCQEMYFSSQALLTSHLNKFPFNVSSDLNMSPCKVFSCNAPKVCISSIMECPNHVISFFSSFYFTQLSYSSTKSPNFKFSFFVVSSYAKAFVDLCWLVDGALHEVSLILNVATVEVSHFEFFYCISI